MFDQLVNQFMASPQGQTAFSRLGAQGFAPHQAQAFMGAALPTAAQSFLQAQQGGMAGARPSGPQGVLDVGNSHYVTNFLSGAVSGLVRGQGLMGAAVDGLQGVVGGHVAQVLATRFGLPQRVAGTVGAILTPLAVDWLWERANGGTSIASLLGGGGASGGGAAPSGGAPGIPGIPGMGGGIPGMGGGIPGMGGGLPGVLGALTGLGGGAPPPPAGGGWGGAPHVPQPTPGAGLGGGGAVSPTIPGGLGSLFNLFKG
jgi:hypothetical protein